MSDAMRRIDSEPRTKVLTMTKLNIIAMTKFLRTKGWPFRRALDTARAVRDLASNGTLPPADVIIAASVKGAAPVSILQLEIAGGVVRLTFVPLADVVLG